MIKERGAFLTPVPLWIGFLAGNLERGFLTTLGLLLPDGGGICSSKISIINLLKKKVIVLM